MAQAEQGRYSFLVDSLANKHQIARAVNRYFGVKVKKVRTAFATGRVKKAIVELAKGEKIELLEGD